MSATYLPVYTLAEKTSPVNADALVIQSSETNGDVMLLPISSFISTFLQSYIDSTEIDSTTIALYESMGWTQPT